MRAFVAQAFRRAIRGTYPVTVRPYLRERGHHGPNLAFASAVNGEMGDFGGVVVVLDGKCIDLVRDVDYGRRRHAREIRALLKRWGQFLRKDRDWRLVAVSPWKNGSMPVDALFDDDFVFYFRAREQMAAFRKRYRTGSPMRFVDGEWRRTR